MNLPVFWVTYSKHLFLCFQHFENKSKRRGHRQKNLSPTAEITASSLGFGAQSMTLSNMQQAADSICGNLPFSVLSTTEAEVCNTKHAIKERVSWTLVRYWEHSICQSAEFIPSAHLNFQVSKTHDQFVSHNFSVSSEECEVPLTAAWEFHQQKFYMCMINQNS